MRISRPCYDKAHRCPGWAGGGWRFARRTRCWSGTLRHGRYYEGPLWAWRFTYHDCGTLVLPYVVRYVDPTWWRFVVRRRLEARRDRHEERSWT